MAVPPLTPTAMRKQEAVTVYLKATEIQQMVTQQTRGIDPMLF